MDFHLKDFTQTHMMMMLKQIEDTNSELSFLRQELDIKNKELELYEVKISSLETRLKTASLWLSVLCIGQFAKIYLLYIFEFCESIRPNFRRPTFCLVSVRYERRQRSTESWQLQIFAWKKLKEVNALTSKEGITLTLDSRLSADFRQKCRKAM